MYLASAYPNSALSLGPMMAIAFVAVATLACWLILVFVAARDARRAARLAGTPRRHAGQAQRIGGARLGSGR